MSYTITIDAARSRIAIVVAPPVSEYDALKCFAEVRNHPEFHRTYGILINLLAADRTLSPTEAEHLGGAMSYLFPNHKIALVRNNLSLTPAIDALRAAASSNVDVRIFGGLSAAEAWLAG